ncbi:COG3378 Phage associated DNA primase [uncultured Caudovirales phage]|uniref:COG3378 Phage associated DNA primase n=1 Tax=uncultured Caudovirales phage TaxID=2100421 RepID=A0A6J5RGP3_9CAUD|nr:COG3378 Phage associated DNA primase [uncultured Caudovirales phage]
MIDHGADVNNNSSSENVRPLHFAPLAIGSQVEIAHRLRLRLQAKHKTVVGCEGMFWFFNGQCWQAYDETFLRRLIHDFDGADYPAGGKTGILRITDNFILGTLACLNDQVSDQTFFSNPQTGICCNSGFITVDRQLLPHSPDQRHRYVLPGSWEPDTNPKNDLLMTFLNGSFKDDPEADIKIRCLRQLAGCIALGYATRLAQPKAITFWGQSANNGKSQMFELFKALVPADASCSLSLAGMNNSYFVPQLAGKLLNVSAESPDVTIHNMEMFKKIITGDDIDGREVRNKRVQFKPQAQHVFACNRLPSIRGMDNGMLRRLLVISFLRSIPPSEQVERIGALVAAAEADALLAWAVEGATDLLLTGGFLEPPSSRLAIAKWERSSDSVVAWFDQFVESTGRSGMRRIDAYESYRDWMINVEREDRTKVIVMSAFSDRVSEHIGRDVEKVTAGQRGWRGVVLKKQPSE